VTYAEISKELGVSIPKSTLNYWLRSIPMSDEYYRRISVLANKGLAKARIKSATLKKEQTAVKAEELKDKNRTFFNIISDSPIFYKLLLVSLYWAEGSKTMRGSVDFGNSDPGVIRVFLSALRGCYAVDENKFRVTLQCRADSDIKALEKFWRKVTGIRRELFYNAQIDPRTIGKPTLKKEYKGVCRITYFSADILNDIIQATKVLPEIVQ